MPNPGPSTTVTANQVPLNSGQALRLLSVARAVNVNAVGDTALPILTSATWSVSNVIVTNASVSLTAAAAGVFTAPGAGGTAIVASAALAGLTGPTVVSQRTVATTAAFTATPAMYLNVSVAQGAAATVDVFIYGYDLS